MIEITPQTDLGRRNLLFVAGEDDKSCGEGKDRWVLRLEDQRFIFRMFSDPTSSRQRSCESAHVAVFEFFETMPHYHPKLYQFQSQEEMEQWLNRP